MRALILSLLLFVLGQTLNCFAQEVTLPKRKINVTCGVNDLGQIETGIIRNGVVIQKAVVGAVVGPWPKLGAPALLQTCAEVVNYIALNVEISKGESVNCQLTRWRRVPYVQRMYHSDDRSTQMVAGPPHYFWNLSPSYFQQICTNVVAYLSSVQ